MFDFLGGISTFLGLAGLISGVLALAAYGRSKLTAQLWKEEAGVQEKRYLTTKEELTAANAKADVLAEKAKGVEEQLSRLVTQQPAVEKLAAVVGQQHVQIMEKIGNLAEELGNIAKAISSKAASETRDRKTEVDYRKSKDGSN